MPIKGIVFLVIMVIVLAWCFRNEITAWVKKETKDSENKGENQE